MQSEQKLCGTSAVDYRRFSETVLIRSNTCPICSRAMAPIIDLPRFPLTERYEPASVEFVDRGYFDQALLFCEACTHGKLAAVVPPAELYGADYLTRSAGSVGSLAAIDHFASFITETPMDGVQTVIDIGGNDASLVGRLPGACKVVVDPHADGDVHILRAFIEDADLGPWKADRKLIVSSHTLEHIQHPQEFIDKVNSVCMHGDWLAIQVPGLDALVHDARIDHIHHQHIHYFSRRSLSKLLAKAGFEIVRHRYDFTHYGALMMMCRKGAGEASNPRIVPSDILSAQRRFKAQMRSARVPEESIAFGAALMLPVLAYHLPALAAVEYIADNSKAKHGLRYINFDRAIRSDYDLKGRDVVITGISTKLACRALVAQAFEKGARNVLVPLNNL